MPLSMVRLLFGIAGAYDFVIGLGFLFMGPAIFEWAGTTPPNHWGYVYFVSLLLLVFGLMFFAVARDPVANRNLMPFGILLKISYAGLVAYYWATVDCPMMFKPFAIIDAVMAVLFMVAYFQRPSTSDTLAKS